MRRSLAGFCRRAALYHIWVKLALCLALFTVWVQRWFVPRWLAVMVPDPPALLRTFRGNTQVGTVFTLLAPDRFTVARPLVVLIGDSAVAYLPFNGGLAERLRAEIRARMPGQPVELLDLSIVGMLAPDALLFVAKALSLRPDLVVYATSPRSVPSAPPAPFATTVGDVAFEWDIASRVGPVTALGLVGWETAGRALAHSLWPPARLRMSLALALRHGLRESGPGWLADTADNVLVRAPFGDAPIDVATAPGDYQWPRAAYRCDLPTRSTRALDALIDLCGREGRCLVYQVPLNRDVPHGFEPGLADEFVAHVAGRAAHARVPFHDLRSLGDPEYFLVRVKGGRDAIHPTAEGHEAFARPLADAVVARLRELGP